MIPYSRHTALTAEFAAYRCFYARRRAWAIFMLAASVAMFASGISGAAAERTQPLRIQIPSLPDEMPQAEVVDNDLPVHLLDAQMPAPPTPQQVSRNMPKHASGNLTIGAATTPAPQAQPPTAADAYAAPAPTAPKRIVIVPQDAAAAALPAPTAILATASTLPDPNIMQGQRHQEQKPTAHNLHVPMTSGSFPAPGSVVHATPATATIAQAATEATADTSASPFSNVAATLAAASPESNGVLAMPVPTESALKNFLHYYPTQSVDGTVIPTAALKQQLAIVPPAEDAALFASDALAAQNQAPMNQQTLADATEALGKSASSINPFESDMATLSAWAEQKAHAEQPAAANAQMFAALTPAAGSMQQTDAVEYAPQVAAPPVRSAIIIDLLSEDEADRLYAGSLAHALSPQPVASAPVQLQAPPASLPRDMPFAVVPKSATAAITTTDIAPQTAISSDTERLLKRVPSKLDTPKKATQRIDIEREHKATTGVFSELDGAQDVASHEAMGIKIEVKKPALDANYEMDRAYNAVLAGETETAKEIYKRVLQSDSRNINALFAMGAILHRAGDITAARDYYARVLALDPDNRDTLNNFLSLVADEAPEAALGRLKELEARNPDFSPIPAQISYVYQKLGNISQAGRYMLKALSLAPDNITYKYNLAVLLDKQGAREDAARFYQELVDAHMRGETLPGNFSSIQERLTFLRSNR